MLKLVWKELDSSGECASENTVEFPAFKDAL